MKKNSSRSAEMRATVDERNAGAKNAPGPDYQAVVGLDVGDRKTHYCVLGLDGELVVEGAVTTRKATLRVQVEGKARMLDRVGGRSALKE